MESLNMDRVDYADRLVSVILNHGMDNKIPLDDVVAGTAIALRLLGSLYSDPKRLFKLLQEAEGELDMLVHPSGDPC